MKRNSITISSMLVALFCFVGFAQAQDAYETKVLKGDIPSPKKEMKAMVGDATVTVVYGSPSVKGREVWGGLVPYDKVWRAGANEATTIELSKDVKVEGKTLAAGKYSFFTIPGETEWTIIFNSEPKQWGAYKHNADKDVLKVTVSPKAVGESSETLEYVMDGDALVLKWEKLTVPIKLM
ncbi:DUF2911 domain-containing protein [Flammeovirgaceae bacterium SG7u.111]|nr:DUF2911 domain-containing protein [Flammeovirgaceae bacterium SG7u.132]WPO33612.1 DUF2911 domain-containing protein [Flammeovirgaceae bacterium SG7u.111]